MMGRRHVLPAIAVTLAALAGVVHAQWRAVDPDGQSLRAEVRNDNGAVVRISMDDDAQVFAVFQLPDGLTRLDPKGCPTFQIDDEPPEDLSQSRHACEVSSGASRVRLAQVDENRVRSPTLQYLIDGRELVVRFRLLHAGYGESRFTLRRSKQALTDVLGESTEVVGE